jgi:hypothetical protein
LPKDCLLDHVTRCRGGSRIEIGICLKWSSPDDILRAIAITPPDLAAVSAQSARVSEAIRATVCARIVGPRPVPMAAFRDEIDLRARFEAAPGLYLVPRIDRVTFRGRRYAAREPAQLTGP